MSSDGKIVAVGSSSIGNPATNVVVYRLNDDGTPDTSFNTTGHVSVSAGTGTCELLTSGAVAITPNGEILVAGGVDSTSIQAFFLLRLTSAGVVDTTFSASGFKTYTTTAAGQYLRFYAKTLAIESTGRITVGGFVYHLVNSTGAESNNPALFHTDSAGTLSTDNAVGGAGSRGPGADAATLERNASSGETSGGSGSNTSTKKSGGGYWGYGTLIIFALVTVGARLRRRGTVKH